MTSRVTETDLAMLLLEDEDLVTLGALLGLRAREQSMADAVVAGGVGGESIPPPTRID